MERIKIGLAQGRFHIIHWGHMEYLLEAKKLCEHLIIGITDCDPERAYFNYDKSLEEYDKKNLKKPFRSINEPIFPFTFYDRKIMIKNSMIDEGISSNNFDIVPFPLHKIHLLKYYIPEDPTIFITIYDDWGRKKVEMFKNMGFKTKILWERDMSTRFTTGTEVRRRISHNEEWEHLVPKAVYNYITENNLHKVLQKIGK